MAETPLSKIHKKQITIGADPEFFLYDRFMPISAIGLIGGTKHNPAPLGREGFSVQEDNVAVEFNIPPAKSIDEFVESINWSLDTIRRVVNENGLSIKLEPSARFDDKQLEHPQAMQLGCDPDYNAWTGKMNPRPELKGVFKNLRSCGGHVHIGWEEPDKDPEPFRRQVIKAMDLFLGAPSVRMDMNWARRELYGKAGAFRPTSYGVEYRTLSNFWLRRKEYMQWVYAQTHRAFEFASDMAKWAELDSLEGSVAMAINKGDFKQLEELSHKYNLAYVT